MKRHAKSNPQTMELVQALRKASREHDAPIWRDIATRLEKPNRSYAEVNIDKINRYAKDGETLLIPGKVLGGGVLGISVTVAALNFSEAAQTKITDANGRCMSIADLMAANPSGSRVKIMR
jgi:large subunit ribosomal protein L18e